MFSLPWPHFAAFKLWAWKADCCTGREEGTSPFPWSGIQNSIPITWCVTGRQKDHPAWSKLKLGDSNCQWCIPAPRTVFTEFICLPEIKTFENTQNSFWKAVSQRLLKSTPNNTITSHQALRFHAKSHKDLSIRRSLFFFPWHHKIPLKTAQYFGEIQSFEIDIWHKRLETTLLSLGK